MNYKIAICDDAAADREYVVKQVKKWAEQAGHTIEIQQYSSAESFLFQYAEHKDFDILLLDIEMGEMNGVTLAKAIREENETVQIVFITGFSDFIAEGYEVSALHYLMKPVSEERLISVLDKAAAQLKKQETFIILQVEGEAVRLAVSEILYVESFAHSCRVHTAKGSFEVRQGISEMEQQLGEGFIRTHRSYLVGFRGIRRISKTDVILDNGETVRLSRSQYQTVNLAFIRYFRGEK